MQNDHRNNRHTLRQRMQRAGLQMLFACALSLIAVLGSGSSFAAASVPTTATAVHLTPSLPQKDERKQNELFGEQGERLLRAVDRWLRTLAQNRTLRPAPAPYLQHAGKGSTR
ncbi:MAG: hypothetical protein U0Y68_26645 [Blastocatellia bacterium]